MKIRAIAPNEWKYTYSQSMQITGQTGNIGHLRGDFDSGGYGFYTTWNDHRPQWKTDEFKTEMDYVINALRSPEYGLLFSIVSHRTEPKAEIPLSSLMKFICCSNTNTLQTSFLPFGSVCVSTVRTVRVSLRM